MPNNILIDTYICINKLLEVYTLWSKIKILEKKGKEVRWSGKFSSDLSLCLPFIPLLQVVSEC